MFKDAPFQSIFEFRERRSGRLLSSHCQIHVLQLEKIKDPATPEQSLLLHWAHFLANKDPARYDELARFDPGIHNAMTTLKTLSQDEKTRMLAQAREEYARLHYEDLRVSRSEGREEGREEGVEIGQAKSLRKLIAKRFGSIPEKILEVIASAHSEQLDGWFDRAIDADSLDDVFRLK